jgi:hypothetical protein
LVVFFYLYLCEGSVSLVKELKMWTPERIKVLLESNDLAVERAVVAIYDRQTADEKSMEVSRRLNSVGFSGAHARRGTYYARWVLSGRRLTGGHLEAARAMMIKYRRQLVEIANG